MIESEIKRSLSVAGATPAALPLGERRRPGRTAASPSLLPLLRDRPGNLSLVSDRDSGPSAVRMEYDDSLRPARGITLGILLSVPIWAILLGMVHTLLRLTLHS
jgi:hypothetical protein